MNKEILSQEMADAGISVSEMCKILGISRKSFWEKRSGKTEFKLSEASTILKALHRDDPRPIFFDNLVS